jgi:ABC-type Fe3+-hydroxamate transport system substrate-binding protein
MQSSKAERGRTGATKRAGDADARTAGTGRVTQSRLFSAILLLSLLVPAIVMTAAVLRSPAVLPASSQKRIVMDIGGKPVDIPLPFRGTALMQTSLSAYLGATQAPDSVKLAYAEDRRDIDGGLTGEVYPALRKLRRFTVLNAQGHDLEALMALHPSAVIAVVRTAIPLRRIGLPAIVSTTPHVNDLLFGQARIYADIIGEDGRYQAMSNRYNTAMNAYGRRLRPWRRPGGPACWHCSRWARAVF